MKKISLLCFMILILVCQFLDAATIYVDVNNVTGPEDGTQARPFNTIQEGVDNASDGDTVLVDKGIYKGIGNVNVEIKKNLTVESVMGADSTVIDCQRVAAHAITFTDNSSVLDGFMIKNATSMAIRCISTDSTIITNCIITENYAGINLTDSNGEVTHCKYLDISFRNNQGGLE